jgi:hypothetical protein
MYEIRKNGFEGSAGHFYILSVKEILKDIPEAKYL